MDLWAVMDASEATPPSNVDPPKIIYLKKEKEKHQKHVNKAMLVIELNLADNQLIIIFIHYKFFTCKKVMTKFKALHITKFKALLDWEPNYVLTFEFNLKNAKIFELA